MPGFVRGCDRAIVIFGHDAASVVQAMLNDIHEALLHCGVDSMLHSTADSTDIFRDADPETYFAVDCNNRSLLRGIRKVSLMGDHPCARLDDLLTRHTGREILLWPDASHLPAYGALGLPHAAALLPNAGPDPVATPLPMRDRDIDVLFCGSLAEPVTRAAWAAEHPNWPDALTDIVFDTMDRIMHAAQPAVPAFIEACTRHGVAVGESFSRTAFCEMVTKTMALAEINRRLEVLSALPDVKLGIISNYLPASLRDRPSIVNFGYIDDIAAVRKLMGRSKIVLDTSCKFPEGEHERIWFGMAEGAVVMTDPSLYVARDFRDGAEILYLPKRQVARPDLAPVRGLLDDDARLQSIADAAAPIYARDHTWKQRIPTLLGMLAERRAVDAA